MYCDAPKPLLHPYRRARFFFELKLEHGQRQMHLLDFLWKIVILTQNDPKTGFLPFFPNIPKNRDNLQFFGIGIVSNDQKLNFLEEVEISHQVTHNAYYVHQNSIIMQHF